VGHNPHVVCISEHHTKFHDITHLSISGYEAAATYCRRKFLNRCVCILVREGIKHQVIDVDKKCKEKNF
jgi:hypothetical protein